MVLEKTLAIALALAIRVALAVRVALALEVEELIKMTMAVDMHCPQVWHWQWELTSHMKRKRQLAAGRNDCSHGLCLHFLSIFSFVCC